MSSHLQFFDLARSPFEGRAQAQVVLGTRAIREAFAAIEAGLRDGASRICVSGGPGLGKTSLARALPKLLGEQAQVALILDPALGWDALRDAIAKQWGLDHGGLARNRLLEATRSRPLVLVIDQAERASEEFLDHLDIVLSYRSDADGPVVQSVLLAQLTGNDAPEPPPLLWWLDRIQTLQLEFAPLPREGVEAYIHKHLKRAGWRGPRLFTPDAARAIHGYTGGIPRDISTLCERLLVLAAERDLHQIDEAFVHALCDEGAPETGPAPAPDAGTAAPRTAAPAHTPHTPQTAEAPAEEPWTLDEAIEDFGPATPPRAKPLHEQTHTRHPEKPAPEEAEADRLASQKAALPRADSAAPANDRADRPSLAETLAHFDSRAEPSQTTRPPPPGSEQDTQRKSPAPRKEEADAWGLSQAVEESDGEPDLFDANAELDDETDAELEALERALSAPPTAAELREIQGSRIAQFARPLIVGGLLALAGGIAFALLTNDPTRGPDATAESSPHTAQPGTISPEPAGAPTVLGRIRRSGTEADSRVRAPARPTAATERPVTKTTKATKSPPAPRSAQPSGGTRARALAEVEPKSLIGTGGRLKRVGSGVRTTSGAIDAEDLLAEPDPEEEQIDLRPAALAPSATAADTARPGNR